MEKFSDEEQELSMQVDEDDEYAPTADEMREEENEEPLMMVNAERWDRFLSFVKEIQRPWAPEEEDTDLYRKERAVKYFNHALRFAVCVAMLVAADLFELKPTLQSW
eukprot:6194893-Pleurochrysis_carterae.AAC.1